MAEVSPGHLRLVIVTPLGETLKAEVEEVQAPGAAGEFGVLPGHIPFLAAIDAGVLAYRESGKPNVLAVGRGYVQVGLNDRVVVLTDATATPASIDVGAVTAEERQATAALQTLSPEEQPGEYAHQQAMQAWARARLEAAARSRNSAAH